MLKRLSHVSLGTPDLPRTLEFYQSLLGCKIVHEFRNAAGELYGAFLTTGGGTFLEFFNDQNSKPPNGYFRHICLEVDDIEATAARFRAAGHTIQLKRGRTDRVLQFFVTDPTGTMVEFHQHDQESVLFPHTRDDKA